MSGDEPFLARWSRRKRDAAVRSQAKERPPAFPAAAPPAADAVSAAVSLQPIETIDAVSDITAFLAPGVPLELMRAALRRAWSVDPAIHDFIGLSENAWDFNAAGGISGFGPLELRDVRELAARVFGDAQGNAAAAPVEAATAAPVAATSEPPASIGSPQRENTEGKPREPSPCRRHGAAVPQ